MLVPLSIPAGVYANGTTYEGKGRWVSASLVRWAEGAMGPIGGWSLRSSAAAMSGAARAMLAWKDNSGVRWIAVGTHSNLYIRTESDALHDITPTGFVTGRLDAVAAGGYGSGAFGAGTYGTPRPDVGTTQDATVWTLDTFGQYLVGCSPDDGKIYAWTLDPAVDAAVIGAAPASNEGIVVTAERFLFALNGRNVAWCDQGDYNDWTPSATNQAGDQDLQTHGSLKCGRRIRGGTLLFTDVDVHLATYQPNVFVYDFERVGNDCGLIANGAVVSLDTSAVWMGRENFWIWDGVVRALPSDVSDYVFSDFNAAQASKVSAFHNSAFGEVWWFYPSGASNECDRAVSWNYRERTWATHAVGRLCAIDAGLFRHPMAVDASGYLYEHEKGWTYTGTDGPYARSGPFELGTGERLAMVRQLIPDERTSGDVTVTFYTRMYPNGSETERGPYTLSQKTDVLFTARQVSLQVNFDTPADSRWGEPRVDVVPGAKR